MAEATQVRILVTAEVFFLNTNFYYTSLLAALASLAEANNYFCNRGTWRESYKDDITLGFKAITGNSDWVKQQQQQQQQQQQHFVVLCVLKTPVYF